MELNPHDPFPYQQLSSIYSRQKEKRLAAEFSKRANGMMFNQQQQNRIERLSQENPAMFRCTSYWQSVTKAWVK
jgi:hypothetical protein